MRLIAAVLALVVVALTGCSVHLRNGDDTHRLEVRGTHTAFDVDVPEEWAITDVWDADTCGSVSYRIAAGSEARILVKAVPTRCAEAAQNAQIGSGFHGVYRTVDDVPDPQGEKSVDTGLGPATVFTQKYFECTNSCDDWKESVGVVTLEALVDAGYPTLVLRGEKDTVSRAELEEIVASLAAPDVPTG